MTPVVQIHIYMGRWGQKPAIYDNCTFPHYEQNPSRFCFEQNGARIHIFTDQIIAVSIRDQPASPATPSPGEETET